MRILRLNSGIENRNNFQISVQFLEFKNPKNPEFQPTHIQVQAKPSTRDFGTMTGLIHFVSAKNNDPIEINKPLKEKVNVLFDENKKKPDMNSPLFNRTG